MYALTGCVDVLFYFSDDWDSEEQLQLGVQSKTGKKVSE